MWFKQQIQEISLQLIKLEAETNYYEILNIADGKNENITWKLKEWKFFLLSAIQSVKSCRLESNSVKQWGNALDYCKREFDFLVSELFNYISISAPKIKETTTEYCKEIELDPNHNFYL